MSTVGGYNNVPVIRQTVVYKSKSRAHYGKFFRFVGSICLFFILVLLVFNIFKHMNGSSNLSFTAFLEWLSTVSSDSIQVDISDYGIGGSWGLFDFFREFLDKFAKFFGCLAWLGANLFNFISFVGKFIAFLLV